MTDTIVEHIGDTTLSVADLALIGQAVLNLAATSLIMRHTSPAGSVEYTEPSTVPEHIACDFATWTTGGSQRLTRFLSDSGWFAHVWHAGTAS